MLAATARPGRSATRYVPHPGRDRLVAALAAQGGARSRPSSRSRRRATAGAGGSPARSAASWPQAAPTSWPRLRRMVVRDAGLAERRGERAR